MLRIPAYRLLGTYKTTGSVTLLQVERVADGRPGLLKTPTEASARERERYRREFAILQRLHDVHGVPKAHACDPVVPALFIEQVEGSSLSELVGQPLEPTRFLELALALTSILAEIHHHGVIHKDLKPSNILITPQGGACIIDFGIATFQRMEHVDAAPPSLIEGTLAYMSPEQTGRMNRSVDYRTDFYSLGVTFYEMLTGTRPFRGRDALEWFHAHLAQSPRPPHELVPTIPPALSALVLKLLSKVAEERYLSASGLLADLERCRQALQRGEQGPFPLGEHDAPTHFQLPQQLYGREAHVSTLLQGLERVIRSDKPELAMVRGYAGIGKSSVVNELHKPVVQRRGFFLSGKFDQFQRDIPYATLAQAIRSLVQHLLAGSDEELASWRERMHEAWQGDGQVLIDVIPQLELVTGKQPPVQLLPPAEAKHRFNRVFRRFLKVFATAEHPLVIFLDDVQWADLASLQLLQHLLTHESAPPVLWLVAYRDNEISPSHPLVTLVEAVRRERASVTDLQLEPLSLGHVQHLVTDALPGAGSDVVEPLSALAFEKTGGNPFFLLQLMVTLNQDGLLRRTASEGWQWDAAAAHARGYSDNVVDFLVGRLRQLPPEAQHLLRLAACVRNAFSLSLLAAVSGRGEVGQVEQTLAPVLQEGLLVRSGLEQYRFLHDRLQQAAHALLSPEDRPAVHLRIGRLLLEHLSPEEIHAQLFDVVSQLNAGASLLEEPAERLRAATLNVEAGSRAMSSVAHQSAIAYFKRAFELLPSDAWDTEYALTFKLRLAQARCEFLTGQLADARLGVEQLQARARTCPDMAAVACLNSDLFLVKGERQSAVGCLLQFLARQGLPIPARPSWQEVEAAHDELWAELGDRSIESLVDLPLMTDPDMKAVMEVLATMARVAFLVHPYLYTFMLCRVLLMALRHGNSGFAAYAYGLFGAMTNWYFHRHREGYAFGLLAQALVERHHFTSQRGRVHFAVGLLNIWTQPMSEALEFHRSALHLLIEAGDFFMASAPASRIVGDRLSMGHPLEEVYTESVTQHAFVGRLGFRDIQDQILVAQRYIQQLRGLSHSFGTMSGEGFDEEAFEAGLTAGRLPMMQGSYWILKMRSRFMCGAYEQALEAGARAAEFLEANANALVIVDYHLCHALALAACHESAAPERRQESLDTLRQHQQRLAEWAGSCPQNFLAQERMVSAELARLQGRRDEANCLYEEAIQAAHEHGLLHHVALANELAARFWRPLRAPSIFKAFARAARDAYRRWGALGKVHHLEALWPDVLSPEEASASDTTTSTDSTQVDAVTVVKAQQAISREIVLEQLTGTLMQVAIENAGAQRGALLLPHGDSLTVVATSGDSQAGSTLPAAAGEPSSLPWSLITYVKRTREHVLIDDASKPHLFSADPSLAHGKARSLLCLPLLRQDEFYGALYLENSLATNAFTPARLSLLEHLASQAVISFENARLYDKVRRAEAELRRANDELERRVEERSRELRKAQARLVDTAREIGMAEVASNVLHNVGNVLTSAVINVETLLGLVESSRVDGVVRTAAMLEEHQGNLGEFFARDRRGSRLPRYLSALGEELVAEQAGLREGLQEMGQYIEHIRAIVHVQQDYAKTALLMEECDLPQLIEDALRIQLAALRRHRVSIIRELAEGLRVTVDKHKVLQILLNLLSNAKDALDEVPEEQRSLRVRLTQVGSWARIQIVDTGSGFAPEIRKHLFTHGFTTRKGGHGFGLHSCALAAQLLGGQLSLDSPGPGEGATATLEIPLT